MNSKVRGVLQELSRCREGYSSAHMLASIALANSYPAGTLNETNVLWLSEAALMWCISLSTLSHYITASLHVGSVVARARANVSCVVFVSRGDRGRGRGGRFGARGGLVQG